MAQPIQTQLELLFTNEKKNVTEDIVPDLLSFEYGDKETNEADEISLTLMDPLGKWAGRWKPDAGEIVRAGIIGGTTTGAGRKRYCGKFYVDSLRTSGSPRVFELKAVSIPLNKPIRKKLKTRAWEKKTLWGIAEKIASEAGVKLVFDSRENPSYERQDQKRESDLKFLSGLCEEQGLSIKLTDDQIVIFDQESYEKKDPVKTFELGVSNILSWDFESQQSETYKSCTVSWRDPKKKKRGSAGSNTISGSGTTGKSTKNNPAVHTYTYTDPDADENGQEYALKKRATSIADARRLAKAKLRQLNMRRVTGSMAIVGDADLYAGDVITCKGFGSFDGNFIISEARHTVGTGGYTTSLSLRRVNANY